MPETVTEYLQRARDCAALADKMTGEDKKKLLGIADAWLKLADQRAKELNSPGDARQGKPGGSGP
jgi:hypothetical protein